MSVGSTSSLQYSLDSKQALNAGRNYELGCVLDREHTLITISVVCGPVA